MVIHLGGFRAVSEPPVLNPQQEPVAQAPRAKDEMALTAQRQQLDQRLHMLSRHPQPGSLQHQLLQTLERQWRFQRTVHQDWLNNTPYAQQRRSELRNLAGGARVQNQYGLSFAAARQDAKSQSHQLRIGNQSDSDYQRDNPSAQFLKCCRELYTRKGGNPSTPVLFVNHEDVARRILCQIPSRHLMSGSIPGDLQKHCKELAPGVLALEMRSGKALERGKELCYTFGGTPSAFQVMRGLSPANISRGPRRVDNRPVLEQLRGTPDNNVCDRLRRLPPNHAMAPLANIAANMIDDLLSQIEDSPRKNSLLQSPLLGNSLNALHKVADGMPLLTGDTLAFTNGYQALMEELQVCLTTVKPYGEAEFREAASAIVADGLSPTLPAPQTYLMSSGMGAMAQGMELLDVLTAQPMMKPAVCPILGTTPMYYELENLQHDTGNNPEDLDAGAIFATLNHSLPGGAGLHQAGWGVDAVISATENHLSEHLSNPNQSDPMVLMLDATVEKPGDMERLLSHFSPAIERGELRMVICKSYQKYANLGAAKVMAGGIALVSRDDETARNGLGLLADAEQKLNWAQNDESQLLTHMLRHRYGEFNLLEHATSNARHVSETYFNGKQGHAHFDAEEEHTPFTLYVEGNKHRFTFALGEMDRAMKFPRSAHLPTDMIGMRDSFGFNTTSLTDIPIGDSSGIRISFGHESHAELAERFFMPSLLMHKQGSSWSPRQACKLFKNMVDQSLQHYGIRAQGMSMSQKLTAIAQREQATINASDRLESSPEQLRQLLQEDGQRGTTLNKLASILIHQSQLIRKMTDPEECEGGPDREELDELLEGMIQAGLPGISSAASQSILALHRHFCLADMLSQDAELEQSGFNRLSEAARRLPGQSANAESLLAVPDDVFASAEEKEQQVLLDACFRPLDAQSKLLVIGKLLEEENLGKAEACIDLYESQLDNPAMLSPNTLYSNSGRSNQPQQISARQRESLHASLMKHRLALDEDPMETD
ncbi:hypothetical protein ACKC9G_09430 [Pokkaliibacter sp. CJK22405]|uniref:hypothetical protein n=1 Tax=Pokkaliibacter sp. CJK22405 TaxID=3384615 RepID=UPI003984AB27